jgi:hypothetical protein
MNQRTRASTFNEKNRGRKSPASVPLKPDPARRNKIKTILVSEQNKIEVLSRSNLKYVAF